MANSEHLAKLREGPEAWNRWRKEHADVVPDLSGAMLRGAILSRANLRMADFYRTALFVLPLLPVTQISKVVSLLVLQIGLFRCGAVLRLIYYDKFLRL